MNPLFGYSNSVFEGSRVHWRWVRFVISCFLRHDAVFLRFVGAQAGRVQRLMCREHDQYAGEFSSGRVMFDGIGF